MNRILDRTHSKTTLRTCLQNEPFTLSLSAGFFGFYAHAGVVSVLEEENLRPTQLTGCSAGALIGGLWASGCRMDDLTEFLFSLQRSDFWDPSFGWGLLAGKRFDDILRGLLNCTTFEQTKIPIQMTVFDIAARKAEYLESGDLALAIRASCAFPGLFQPVRIGQQSFLDGGILDRSGLGGLHHGGRVLYHRLKSRSKLRLARPRLNTVAPPFEVVELCINKLPRVSPFHLERGPEAYAHAREEMKRKLDACYD